MLLYVMCAVFSVFYVVLASRVKSVELNFKVLVNRKLIAILLYLKFVKRETKLIEMASIDFNSDIDDDIPEEPCKNGNDDGKIWRNFVLKATTTDDLFITSVATTVPNHVKDTSFALNRIHLSDVTIETEGNIEYKLEKVTLASKSCYFKELFDSKNQENQDDDKIKIDIVDDGTFSHLVDIIYEKTDLKSMINEDNYMQLFRGMMVLEMETDLAVFEEFITKTIKLKKQFDENILEMFNFIIQRNIAGHLNYLLLTVSKYCSDHLLEASEKKGFQSISYEGIFQILENKTDKVKEKGRIASRICVEWISYQFEDRIGKLTSLVNVVKHRYNKSYRPICDQNFIIEALLKESNHETRRLKAETYFNDLLYNDGDIELDASISNHNQKLNKTFIIGKQIINDKHSTWMSFLREEYLCDVTINVEEVTFKIHKIKLSLASEYFCKLFTEQSESLKYEVDKKSGVKLCHYSLDKIDAITFKKLVQYIYRGTVEITCETDIINLFKASRLLKMDHLYKRSYSCIMKITDHLNPTQAHFFGLFQFVCENEKHTELYNKLAKCVDLRWMVDSEQVHNYEVSWQVFKEVFVLPLNPISDCEENEILDLCAEWVFYDSENRYQNLIELAKAINRNFSMETEQFEIKSLQSEESTQIKQIKDELIKILRLAALVPSNNTPLTKEQKPVFILMKNGSTLSIINGNFENIVKVQPKICTPGSCIENPTATMIDDKLFLLFNIDEDFFFQVYHLSSKRLISLAVDGKMKKPFKVHRKYVILNCKNEIYYCDDQYILKYSTLLNRWMTFLQNTFSLKRAFYTSNGEQLYRIYCDQSIFTKSEDLLLPMFYDFEESKWTSLPKVPITVDFLDPSKQEKFLINVGIINNDLSILVESRTFLLNSVSKTWSSILNCSSGFFAITSYESNIFYVSHDNEIHSFSPISNKWKFVKKLSDSESTKIIPIHRIN